MKPLVLAGLVLFLLSATAVAQDAPKSPCVRGSSTVVMAGIDITELNCEVAVLRMSLSQSVASLATVQAQLAIASNDLAALKKARDDLGKRVEDLEKKCGDACKTEGAKP